MTRAGLLITALLTTTPLAAQGRSAAHTDYFHAVAAFFNLPASEVVILSEWDVDADEIPVILFVARRAGVSPEALVALREAGQGWAALTRRYRVGAAALHVPIRDDAPAGRLDDAYARFRTTPVGEWNSLTLSDHDIVGLVNVRVIAQELDLPAERVLAATSSTDSYVQLYTSLRR